MNTHETNENQNSSKGSCLLTGLKWAIIAAFFLGVAGILFPFRSLPFDQAREAQAAQHVAGIVNAIKLFETQYSVLPLPDGIDPDKSIPTDTPLIDVLSGADRDQNPKEIVFLEGKEANKPSRKLPARSGFIYHRNGSLSLVDPWGNFYMVLIDHDDDGMIEAPDGSGMIEAKVICWSYGKPSKKNDYRSALENAPNDWLTSWR